jgi:hypothetical protein
MLKWWPTFLFALVILFFFASYTPREANALGLLEDGCLIYALHYKHTVLAQEKLQDHMWSRVLAIQFYGKLGHAVTVFVYNNITFVYDPNRGSFAVAGYPLYDPLMIAEICFPELVIKSAYYLEPTFLLHYQYNAPKLVW